MSLAGIHTSYPLSLFSNQPSHSPLTPLSSHFHFLLSHSSPFSLLSPLSFPPSSLSLCHPALPSLPFPLLSPSLFLLSTPPLPSVAALPVTISPSIIWDLHWNSKTTSLWPTNVFTWDDTGELMFHSDKLFSVARLIWGKVSVTRPSPNGWKEIEKLELTEKAMFSRIISVMLTCKLSWLSLLAHSVWRVHLKR